MINPKELFSQSIPRLPLPGEVWSFTKEEAHCFAMEIERIGGFLDREASSVSHWVSAVEAALKSGTSTTNSTAELYALAEAFVAGACAHLWALKPEDPEIWKRALSEIDSDQPSLDARQRLLDAENGVVRLPCEHTALQHQNWMRGWYKANIEDTKFRRATLVRVWNLPAEEKLYGKQFRARFDMEREIEEKIAADNRGVVGYHDPKTRDLLVMNLGMTPDEADEYLEGMRRTLARDTRTRLIAEGEKLYRILE